MTSVGLLGAFLLAATVICVTPGPDMLYVASIGIARGWRGGTAAAVGIAAGMSVHTVLAAFGLSLVITHSAIAFVALKAVGGGYLLYLGISAIRSPHRLHAAISPDASISYVQIGRQATVVNLLNPKIIVFYVTFLPQFVQRHAASVTVQMLILGGIFVVMGLATDATVGILSARLTGRLTAGARLGAQVGYVCGTILCLLAVMLLTGL